jgi:protoporphyrinogen oxidase
MLNYDIAILGGGISSLYFLYNLLKRDNIPKNIILIEGTNRLGGRIHTIYEKDFSMEAGAGRFNDNHKLLNELLKELNLYDKKVEINNFKKFVDKERRILEDNGLDNITQELVNIFDNLSKTNKKKVKNINLYNFCKEQLGKETADKLLERSPYYTNICNENAFDSILAFKKDYQENMKYYILNGGLSQIITSIEKEILKLVKNKKINFEIKYNSIINDITKNNNIYEISSYGNKNIKASRIVCSLLPSTIINFPIFKNQKNMLQKIKHYPIIRVYNLYPSDNRRKNPSWFSNLDKIITNDEIKYIIPVNSKKGVIMTSYTDGIYAKNINNKYLDNTLEKTIEKSLKHLIKEDIPKSKQMFYYYWDKGCHYVELKSSSEDIYPKVNLIKNEEIFLIGEAYSNYHSWIEGSLISSKYVLSKF